MIYNFQWSVYNLLFKNTKYLECEVCDNFCFKHYEFLILIFVFILNIIKIGIISQQL